MHENQPAFLRIFEVSNLKCIMTYALQDEIIDIQEMAATCITNLTAVNTQLCESLI